MQYQVTSDNIEISDSMKALAKEKFEKVEDRLTDKEKKEAMVRIVMNKSGAEDEFKVKIELAYGGKKYFASERDYLLESALIKTVKEVEKMRRRDDISYYEDWKEQRKAKRAVIEPADEQAEDEELFEEELEE